MFKGNYYMATFVAFLIVGLALATDHAFASDATGGMGGAGLPWESPLDKFRRSISGPYAYAVAIIGLIIAGSGLIFGGEIGTFGRVMIFSVMVISVIVFANQLLMTVFSGAVVPDGVIIIPEPQGQS